MPQRTIAGYSLHWQTRRINKKQQIYFKNFVLIYLRFSLFFFTNQLLFTSQLGTEAGQTDGKSLEGREWIPEIHGKHILRHLAKLQYNLIMLGWCCWLGQHWGSCSRLYRRYQLEVLHRSNSHPAPEVEAPTLQLLMPPWGLVSQHQWPLLYLIPIFTLPSSYGDIREARAVEVHRMVYDGGPGEGHATEGVLQ